MLQWIVYIKSPPLRAAPGTAQTGAATPGATVRTGQAGAHQLRNKKRVRDRRSRTEESSGII